MFKKQADVFKELPPKQLGLRVKTPAFVFNIVKKTNEYMRTEEALIKSHERQSEFVGRISIQKNVPYLP